MCAHTLAHKHFCGEGQWRTENKLRGTQEMHRIKQFHLGGAAAIGVAALLGLPASAMAQAPATAAVAIDKDDIGGMVRG
ncbi:MAG TPA: hypothetical protein VKC66_24980, partial [Xanthobacteraceae bacterium]|nr:hypothetical protein [Xanthobacteraceae bacterium]